MKKKVEIAPENAAFAQVVKDLRETLRLTQAELAQKVGVTVTTVSRWEIAERIAEDLSVARMIMLCSDDKLRGEFVLKFDAARRAGMPGNDQHLSESDEALLRDHSDAATGINILFEMAQAGNKSAAETLNDLARTINRRAGDWRKMKYLKK